MRTAACRLHKGFSLEKRMEGAKAALEFDPSARRGAWRRWAPEGGVRPDGEAFSRVVLSIWVCGKGEYTVRAPRPILRRFSWASMLTLSA